MSIFNMTVSIDKYRKRAAPVLAESESMVDAGISNAPICVLDSSNCHCSTMHGHVKGQTV